MSRHLPGLGRTATRVEQSPKPNSDAPQHRGHPQARREHLAVMRCDVVEVAGGLHVSFPLTRETWFWAARSGGWFEEAALIRREPQPSDPQPQPTP